MVLKQTVLIVFVWLVVALQAQVLSAAPNAVADQVDAIMDRAESTGDFHQATSEALSLFAQVAVWSETTDGDQFLEAAYASRLLSQLDMVEGVDRVSLLKYLRANPHFAHVIAFVAQPGEDLSDIYSLVDRFRRERGDKLDTYATLAAAICVVHDKPLERSVNENTVTATDPVVLFDYYRANEKRMLFGLRDVPAELLVYVVDSTASINEMQWALKKYAGNRAVGKLFFRIKYDTAHFRQGSDKKVTAAGYSLPNILKYGGVCADQAYFAVSVGKSIGVPTTYTRGRSSQVSHAWVGYMQAERGSAKWNFDEGRYSVYRGVRGVVEDPQTRQLVPDSVVSLLGEMIGCSTSARHTAASFVDAAAILRAADTADTPFSPPPIEASDTREIPRGTDKAARLELLEAGLRSNPGYAPGWYTLALMASDGELSLADKKRWSGVLMKLCGDKYPDFTLAILDPMIQTIEDPQEQDHIWESAGKLFVKRKDLSAEILMARGRVWAQQGQLERAGRYYEKVVERYVNDGPFVLYALDEIEKILRESNKPGKVLQMYDQTWSRVERPERMAPAFLTQSNWYKIGMRYAERLDELGYPERAAQAMTKIKRVTGG